MITKRRDILRWILSGAVVAFLCCAIGCDEDEEEFLDHVPAAGQGSLVVDNNTVEDIDVFVDGLFQGRVRDGDEGTADMAPGEYRVFLDSADSDRTYQGDVDVLEGRLTILHVSIDSSSTFAFSVQVEYEN